MTSPDRFTWSPETGRYRDVKTGRFVPASAVLAALDQFTTARVEALVVLSEQLRTGAIGVAEWRSRTAAEVKAAHVAASAVGVGGLARLGPIERGQLGAELRKQYEFLRQFADDVASGRQRLDGKVRTRVVQYAKAARGWYFEVRRRLHGESAEERRVLHGGDHCEDCVGYAARGWVRLGTLPRPGEASRCRNNCRCTMEFRRSAR